MPELPEVETLKNSLETKLIGLNIKNVEFKRDSLRYKLSPDLATEILNINILNVRRRAKYLIIDFDSDYSLIVHLGMSGRFTLQSSGYEARKHDHVIFELSDGTKLVFNDTRRFGMIYSFKTNSLEEEFFNNLGLEPFSELLTSKYFKDKLTGRRVPIKNLLMDNKIIVGVGNIYASESLHLAKIHPDKLGSNISNNEIESLIDSIRVVLSKAITAGGTTLKDFVNGDNKPGYFTQQLTVYARGGQECLSCSSVITKTKHSGRATFYCKSCQKS